MRRKCFKCVRCKGFRVVKSFADKAGYSYLVGTKAECSHVWRPTSYGEVEKYGLV